MYDVPLLWAQAADDIRGLAAMGADEKRAVQKALVRTFNIHDTGGLHTWLPLYAGQRVRLTEKLSSEHGLVQEAEGTVLFIVPDPLEDPAVWTAQHGDIQLKYCPLGAWVVFDDCKAAPLAEYLDTKVDASAKELLLRLLAQDLSSQSLHLEAERKSSACERVVFVPAVTRSFKRRLGKQVWQVRRRQLPLTSAKDRTIISSQGKTIRNPLIADMGAMNVDRNGLWCALYVLLSRATRMEDLLLFRCPDKSFFDDGPPDYLKKFLAELHAPHGKIASTRTLADTLILQFGWDKLLSSRRPMLPIRDH